MEHVVKMFELLIILCPDVNRIRDQPHMNVFPQTKSWGAFFPTFPKTTRPIHGFCAFNSKLIYKSFQLFTGSSLDDALETENVKICKKARLPAIVLRGGNILKMGRFDFRRFGSIVRFHFLFHFYTALFMFHVARFLQRRVAFYDLLGNHDTKRNPLLVSPERQ